MEKSVFKRIIDREIPADIVYEDDLSLVFKDINPVAPIHLLIIPKKQIEKIADSTESEKDLLGHLMLVAGKVASLIGANLALIDKPILPTLQGAWKNMPWQEFWKIIGDGFLSLVGGGDFSLSKSIQTGDFSNELKEFSERYPSIKNQLIDRRDTYMSINLIKLFRKKEIDKIVAVVGEGHVEGMAKKLESLNPKIVKLRDLLKKKDNSISFSIEI